MDVMLAAFRFVNEYPGGATALAPVLGKSPTTLSHEVSPSYPTAKFGLRDAVQLSTWANDRTMLSAWAAELGCMLLPLAADVPGVEGVGPRTAGLAREFAELMGTVAADLADGDVSANDLARIEREAGELVGAVQALLALLKGMHERAHAPGLPAAAGASAAPLRAVGG